MRSHDVLDIGFDEIQEEVLEMGCTIKKKAVNFGIALWMTIGVIVPPSTGFISTVAEADSGVSSMDVFSGGADANKEEEAIEEGKRIAIGQAQKATAGRESVATLSNNKNDSTLGIESAERMSDVAYKRVDKETRAASIGVCIDALKTKNIDENVAKSACAMSGTESILRNYESCVASGESDCGDLFFSPVAETVSEEQERLANQKKGQDSDFSFFALFGSVFGASAAAFLRRTLSPSSSDESTKSSNSPKLTFMNTAEAAENPDLKGDGDSVSDFRRIDEAIWKDAKENNPLFEGKYQNPPSETQNTEPQNTENPTDNNNTQETEPVEPQSKSHEASAATKEPEQEKQQPAEEKAEETKPVEEKAKPEELVKASTPVAASKYGRTGRNSYGAASHASAGGSVTPSVTRESAPSSSAASAEKAELKSIIEDAKNDNTAAAGGTTNPKKKESVQNNGKSASSDRFSKNEQMDIMGFESGGRKATAKQTYGTKVATRQNLTKTFLNELVTRTEKDNTAREKKG